MRKTSTQLCLLIASFSCFICYSGYAQITLWPGDINNNGIVNGKDVLRWGYANGASGPGRSDNGANWAARNLSLPWDKNFPEETNFGFGDCNGDGKIDREDVRKPITNHFWKTHGSVQPDFCPVGNKGLSPELKITADKSTYAPGARINLEISLGTDIRRAYDFYGITFQLRYNRDIIRPGAVTYTPAENAWYDPGGTAAFTFFHDDKNQGVIEIAVTRTNQIGANGYGPLGNLSLILRGSVDLVLPGALNLEVDLVQMINSKMEIIPIYYEPDLNLILSDSNPGNSCPDVVEPVCGSDGNTYINSCYAEAAGITLYTQGVCYTECIDPELMKPASECETAKVEPVCGCNSKTYANACSAEAAGITAYTSGPCPSGAGASDCYDPYLVVQSSGTSVHEASGVITIDCPTTSEPVCGCNGITYLNACVAEAAGTAFYTPGRCDEVCVDPTAMDPAASCETEYDPVCGCNGITYSNSCTAEAAGVVAYAAGACGQNSSWCSEAVPIQCGDFLAQETTLGAGNQISTYPGCLSQPLAGADRVYVFEKKTAGDLQIGLEILSPDTDLDLFLLKGTCDEVVCIGSSTTDNTKTPNEGIVLEDAPLGTYYIVVDAQLADVAGNFRLELNCGNLYCGNAQELDCGVPFIYNNSYGEDNVSLYACGPNVYNVENNGPEVVHYFTTTTAAEVNIQLSGLSANLELFLLKECDRGACLQYSENPGTSSETITTYLEPGTYYVVVDGYNGATSDYTLQVNCENTCSLQFSSVTATPSTCSANNGSINIISSGGTPGYIVYYTGPVSGSFSTSSNSCTIYYLPSGTYQIKKIDARGCSVEETVTIYSTGSLEAQITPSDAVCSEAGYLLVGLQGGQAPYRVFLSGSKDASLTFNQANFVIPDLDPGAYSLYILDAKGCSITKQATIQEAESNFYFDITPYPAGCGGLGYVQVIAQNGFGPYRIKLSGPVGGNASAQSSAFKLTKLPGGTYQLTVEDSNECSYTENFTIGDINLNVNTTVLNGICGLPGEIRVQITNGTADYTIKWTGPVTDSVTTSAENYTIQDLPSGDYQVEVRDANQCTGFDLGEVNNSGEGLSSTVQPIDGVCGGNGSLRINISNGLAPYRISWTGAANGQSQAGNSSITVPDLPDGLYDLVITDKNNCQDEHTVYVNSREDLSMGLTATNGNCDQDGSIRLNITNGQPNYIINWEGPVNGSIYTGLLPYDITGLPSGTYQVSVTDAAGCTDQSVIEIENTQSSLVINGSVETATCEQPGAITLNIKGGVAAYQVSWAGPEQGEGQTDDDGQLLIAGLPAGSYQITAVDQQGCTGAYTAVVPTDSGNVGISLSGLNPVCARLGRIQVSIADGSPDFSVSWIGPVNGVSYTSAADFSIVDLAAGTYQVRVTDRFGCEAVDKITLTTDESPALSATATDAVCGQGNIAVVIDGGTPLFHISWNGPAEGSISTSEQSYTIPDLPDGEYRIIVIDPNGCTDATDVVIFSGSQLAINATALGGTCGEQGSIGVSISGGAPGFTLEWDGPEQGNITLNDNYFDITDLPTGSYSITLTDSKGCSDLTSVDLFNTTTNLDLLTALVANECGQENTIRLDISGGAPDYTINWIGPQNGNITTGEQEYELKDLIAGTYQVKVTDAGGCVVESSLDVPAAPIDLLSLTAVSGNCGRSGSIKASITGGTPIYSLSWSGPASGTTTTSSSSVSIDNLPGGAYTVVLTDANGCSESGLIDLKDDQPGLEVDLSIIQNDCGQDHNVLISITSGVAPFLIKWSGPENGSTTASSSEFEIKDLSGGTYEIEVADQKACLITRTITVATDPLDLFSLRAEAGGCGAQGRIKVSIGAGKPGYTLSWSGPENGTANTHELEYVIPDLPAGEYTVTLNDINGCTQSKAVSLQETPALTVEMTGNDGSCTEASSISLKILSGSPGFAISWSGPDSGSITTTNSTYRIKDLAAGAYEVKIVDARGCEQLQTVAVKESVVLPDAAFTYSQDNLSATFTHTGIGDEYLWDFGDGNTSPGTNPEYQFCETGTYEVCLTVRNDCGADTYCNEVSVSISEGVVILDIGEERASAGGTVQVPVRVDQLDYLVSLIGSLEVADGTVAGIQGLSPGLVTPLFNDQDGSFTFYQSNQEGIPVTSGEILFYIDLQIFGSPGQMTAIRFTDQPKAVEVGGLENGLAVSKPHVSLKGQVTIADLAVISGGVSTHWGVPIPDTEIHLTSTGTDQTTTTNVNGTFSWPDLEVDKTYTLRPHKDGFPFNGLSTYSLFIGQQFILGLEPEQIVSPYQIIAGDANCNGSFTTLDLFIIQQLIVGAIDRFNDCPSWVFVPEDHALPADFDAYNVFPYPDSRELVLEADAATNFIGVKVGDLLGQANPAALSVETESEVRSPVDVALKASQQQVRRGEIVEIPLTMAAFQDLVSYQFSLRFDPAVLKFVAFEKSGQRDLATAIAGTHLAERGQLAFSWFSGSGKPVKVMGEDTLMTLHFQALRDIDELGRFLRMEDAPLLAEAHKQAGDRYKLRLDWTGDSSSDGHEVPLEFRLYQNVPNPARKQSTIRFDLPQTTTAELVLHDSFGRNIYRQSGEFAAGINRLIIPLGRLQAGVYYYTLKAGPYVAIRPMIVVK